ncbi:hypothetical protein RB595_009877 [Gaeumannomyces hyphopodioides]
MSFNSDGRRYGHVPPAQYPVPGQQPQAPYGRRSSFHRGDDAASFDAQGNNGGANRGEDELFLSSPTAEPSSSASTTRPGSYGSINVGMAGYQHQYQTPPTPTTYNPAQFASQPVSNFGRSQSTSQVPSSGRFGNTPTTPTYLPQSPTNYTPQTYNPAAYVGTTATNAGVPQRHPTYAGYGNYTPSYNPAAPIQPSPVTSTSAYGQQSLSSTQSVQSGYAPALPSPQYGTSTSSSTVSSQAVTPYDTSSSYSNNNYSSANNNYFNSYTNGSVQSASAYHGGAPQQTPYPVQNIMPAEPSYASDAIYSHVRTNSHGSPLPSPPGHAPPLSPSALQRHPTNAPLPSRPAMENVPEEQQDWDPSGMGMQSDGSVAQDSLMEEIDRDLAELASSESTTRSHSRRPQPINGNLSDDDRSRLRRYETDSDPEGAFGVYEMQQALMDDRRFSGGNSGPHDPVTPPPPLPAPPEDLSISDGGFVMDLGLASGGYAGTLSYDNNIGSPPQSASLPPEGGRPLPTPGASQYGNAHMDYGGTGGLQAPTRSRSFDHGAEHVSIRSDRSGSESPLKDEDYPDMFYHPGLSSRPLPSLPPGSDSSSMVSARPSTRSGYQQHGYSQSIDSRSDASILPSAQLQQQQQQQVERSISLSNHSTTPHVQVPGRSRTDAADERRKAHRNMAQQVAQGAGTPYDGYDTGTPSSMSYDTITLPAGGRRKKFVPAKLSPGDIRRCAEPWALSGIAAWIREMAEGEPDLKQKTIEEGLVKLFSTKVPTMNVADAETLAADAFSSMLEAGIMVREEEWVKFGPGSISGVLWQLTGSGCYSPKLHEDEIPGRCYSHHCTRTLKKANLDDLMSEESTKKLGWAEMFHVTAEQVAQRPKKETERQNILHEIVQSEEEYMNQLEVLRVLYKEQLRAWEPPIITPSRRDKFIKTVFGHADAVQQTNKENLLAQLKYRQNEQGPWITGFSDIFREWIRKAKEPYIAFSAAYPFAVHNVRREAERNLLFRQFLDHVRSHKRSERLGWDTFLKAPITRLQRYGLLLSTVLKNSTKEDDEKANLAKAIEEIHLVTLECDKLVDEMTKKVNLVELQSALVLRPGFQSNLQLDAAGAMAHELQMSGDLQRMGSKGVRWVDTHAFLFDHYFILAKVIQPGRDGRTEKKYDVSKEPIPMPLLFLESMNDDPVSKQKGITAPLARTTAAASGTQLSKVASNGGDRPSLEHTATASSVGSLSTASRLGTPGVGDTGNILYPFKVKHLGHEVYTLYATSAQNRQEWCNKIIEAKTKSARGLHAQNAEPFRLRVLADSAFAYDSLSAMGRTAGVPIRGTPLDRAIRDMENEYGPGRGPAAVCRAQVNCAASFTAFGKSVTAIGTDFGVYISEANSPRGWSRTVQANRVTQMAVLEEFSVCLLIADRSLVSYPLDVVAPVSSFPAPAHDNPRRAPVRLAKDVSFFATARMKDRMLVFFKRKEGMHNTFKVLEPVFQKSTEKKTRLFGGRRGGPGNTEYFRDFDEFYLPTECFSLNLLQTYIAVATAKGFELLTLDKKQTMSVPRDLTTPAIAGIAHRIRDQRPLGMFKLNDQEFLLAYEDCAVYMDKHGEVSRTLVMEYSGKQKKAHSATMFGQYLLLFNEDYVEARNAENGRLRQIIAGRDVRCLDYGYRGPTGMNAGGPGGGGAGPAPHQQQPAPYGPGAGAAGQGSKGTVKICMSHPEVPGQQIVLELLLNDGHVERQ